MLINKFIKSTYRFYVFKIRPGLKIKYLRKQGMIIGDNCRIDTMSFSTEPYLIEIGDKVSISGGTVFITHDAGITCFREEFPNADIFGKIIIGSNVFIGWNSIVLPNTVIGNNCIIGAGSVLRGKFPDNSVIFGNPAKVVMNMGAQRFLYSQNSGKIDTRKLTDKEKKPIVIEHFK